MINKEYKEHEVFRKIKSYSEFYDHLSDSVMTFVSMGVKGILNFDTYAFSSMMGTLHSIHDILLNGRINDAYALLRKYYDSALINVYCNVYLKDHFSLENFTVAHINGWIQGTDKIPKIQVIQNYLSKSEKVAGINVLIKSDKRYGEIRSRGNDHTHYNFYKFALLNDNKIYNPHRINELDSFSKDLEDIFILHLSYLFYLDDAYMMSSDYMDYMEMRMEPPEGCQYEVAPFIQEIFDNVIKKRRPDIATEILGQTSMKLN